MNIKCNQCDCTFACKWSLRIHLKMHSREKPIKCNLCYFSGNLRTGFKIRSGKSQTNAINVTLHPFIQVLWGYIRKHTEEKSQVSATSVTLRLLWKAIWGDIWKLTVHYAEVENVRWEENLSKIFGRHKMRAKVPKTLIILYYNFCAVHGWKKCFFFYPGSCFWEKKFLKWKILSKIS